MFNFEQIWIPT